MIFLQAVRTGFSNYANFKGYATRSEYWLWILFVIITGILAAAIDSAIPVAPAAPEYQVGIFTIHASSIPWIQLTQRLALVLPTLAFTARRLRDAGLGWGHAFWLPVPIAGMILLLVLALNGSVPRAKPAAQ